MLLSGPEGAGVSDTGFPGGPGAEQLSWAGLGKLNPLGEPDPPPADSLRNSLCPWGTL